MINTLQLSCAIINLLQHHTINITHTCVWLIRFDHVFMLFPQNEGGGGGGVGLSAVITLKTTVSYSSVQGRKINCRSFNIFSIF